MRRYSLGTLAPVIILFVSLLIFSDHFIFVRSQPQISYYLGNDIIIFREDIDGFSIGIDVIAWFHPMNINWDEWKENYFNKNPDYYYKGLINQIISMFGLISYSIVDGWVDDNLQRICMRIHFLISQSRYYDKNLNILSFTDVFKQQGAGYYNEINVYSYLVMIYDVEPTPTSRTSHEVHWINLNYYSAPLWYRIYLSPIMQIKVIVEDLPSYKEVSVFVDGRLMGKTKVGVPLTLKLKEGTYTVSIDPYEITIDSREKYVARSKSQSVSSSGNVVFKYIRMFKVKINTDVSNVRVRFDNYWYSLPYEDWIEAGSHTLFAEPSLTKGVGNERTIYSFNEWSVEGKRYSENPLTLSINQPTSIWLLFRLTREFYVEVISEIGHVSGEGWYKEGSLATIYANSPVYDQNNRKRFVFKGWNGDVSGTNQKLEIIVNSPKKILAQWRIEYYVAASSPYGNPQGEGWYEEGSVATIKLEKTIFETGEQERFVFTGWKGDVISTSPIVNIEVNSPKNIQAEWIRQYRVRTLSDFGEIWVEGGEWYNEGDIALIKVSKTQYGFLIVDVLSDFEINGNGIIQNMDLRRGEMSIKVNGPITVRAKWKKDYTGLLIFMTVLSATCIGLAYAYPPSRIKLKTFVNKLIQRKKETEVIRVEKKEDTRIVTGEEFSEEQIRKLKEELEKTKGYLSRIEEEKARGTISNKAYETLKKEYQSKIEWLESEIEKLKKLRELS